MVDKAKTELTELGDNISEAASKAVDTVKTTAAEAADSAKTAYNEHGGVSGLVDKAKTGLSELADTTRIKRITSLALLKMMMKRQKHRC